MNNLQGNPNHYREPIVAAPAPGRRDGDAWDEAQRRLALGLATEVVA